MKKKISLLLLLLISSVVYKDWFSFRLYSYSDYVFYSIQSNLSYWPLSVWRSNYNLGGFDLLFWRTPQNIIYFLGAKTGLEFNVIDRFIVMWPWILLSSVCVYFLIDKYISSEKAKITGSLIFAFNTYFLSISTQGHILISIASCLSILSVLMFINLLDSFKFRYAILTSIFLSLTTMYDLRIWYITSAILVAYLLFKVWVDKKIRNNLLNVLVHFFLMYFIYILMNIYWILPTALGGGTVNQEILDRPLFGNEFLNILYSYSLFHPFWTGAQPAWFENQSIFSFTWILPIMALLGYIVGRKKPFIVFFGILAVIGIFFTKQASIPFPNVYEWFFKNIPGFNAFREASKFYYLVAFSYGVLIAYFIHYLSFLKGNISKYFAWIVVGLVFLLLGWNMKPVVTHEIGSLFIERNTAPDYERLDSFVNDQKEYFRVAWFPRPSWWLNGTSNHPQVGLIEMFNNDWKKFRPKSAYDKSEARLISEADAGLVFLSLPSAQKLLSSASIKYLVLPLSDNTNTDDVYPMFGTDSGEIYKAITKISYLKEINIGTSKLKIFENRNYAPHIYISAEKDFNDEKIMYKTVQSEYISPSQYIIKIKSIKNPFYIVFTDKFSSEWRVLPGDFHFLSAIRSGTKNETSSQATDEGLNSFSINPSNLCKDSKICSIDSQGNYSFEVHLYYRPQLAFFIGIVFSLTVWILGVLLVSILYIRRLRYEKG